MQPQSNLVQSLKDVLLSVSHIEVCIEKKIRISSGPNPKKSAMINSLFTNFLGFWVRPSGDF